MAGFYLHYDGSWQYGNFIHFYADGIADHVWNRYESMWYDCIYVDIGKLYWLYYYVLEISVHIRFTHTGSLYWNYAWSVNAYFPFRTGFVRRTWN